MEWAANKLFCWGSLRSPPTYGCFVGLLGIAALTANLRGFVGLLGIAALTANLLGFVVLVVNNVNPNTVAKAP